MYYLSIEALKFCNACLAEVEPVGPVVSAVPYRSHPKVKRKVDYAGSDAVEGKQSKYDDHTGLRWVPSLPLSKVSLPLPIPQSAQSTPCLCTIINASMSGRYHKLA